MMLYTIEVDNEEKIQGNKRLKKRLLIALLIVVGIAFAILYAENFGIFPGGYLNKPVVNSYLEENYPEYDFDVSFDTFSRKENVYVYDCYYVDDTGAKMPFKMYAKRYNVTDDGFFDAFLRDGAKEHTVGHALSEKLDKKWKETNSDITGIWECTIEIPKSDSETDITTLLKSYDGTTRIEVTLYGEKVTYDEYKEIGTQIMNAVRTVGFNNRPAFVQIYYYRDAEHMQYESQIDGYMLDFADTVVAEMDGVHMYVEVPRDVATEVKIFTIVQYVMLGAIVIAIIVPVSFKIYKVVSKKIKKKKREKDAQNSDI